MTPDIMPVLAVVFALLRFVGGILLLLLPPAIVLWLVLTRRWTWLVLVLFLALLYILGTTRFHQALEPSWQPLFLQKVEVQPWPFFLIVLPLAILLVLLAFRRLEPKDS